MKHPDYSDIQQMKRHLSYLQTAELKELLHHEELTLSYLQHCINSIGKEAAEALQKELDRRRFWINSLS